MSEMSSSGGKLYLHKFIVADAPAPRYWLDGVPKPFCLKCKKEVDSLEVTNIGISQVFSPRGNAIHDSGARRVKVGCHGETEEFVYHVEERFLTRSSMTW